MPEQPTAAPETTLENVADLHEIGLTGLKRRGGTIHEEFLPELQGKRGRKIYTEMAENDPVVGAILFAIEQLVRGADWAVTPSSEDEADVQAAEFLEQCMEDMSHSWESFITEVLSFLKYGWSYFEVCWKTRDGKEVEPTFEDPNPATSKFDDGLLGIRKLAVRGQDTLHGWAFDEGGSVRGMNQIAPPEYKPQFIPITKSLLFRTTEARGNPEGRALDPSTPIITPGGWRTMRDLQEGDKVFDESGRVRYVLATADWQDRPRYAVTFNSGETIIADEEHLWGTTKVWERSKEIEPRIRTTREIYETQKNTNGISNHAIRWAAELDYQEQTLIVDPYVLGLWLGDGTTLAASISTHVDDVEELCAILEEQGSPVTSVDNNGPEDGKGRLLRLAHHGLQGKLRAIEVFGNKHIPEQYLRCSIEQRKSLLCGLMDSDGTVDKDGRCEFTNTNMNLVDSCAELVRSLGCGASKSLRHRANGIDHMQDSFCVKFTSRFIPFRLSRKRDRIKPIRARENHYIVDVTKIDNGATRCIEVDAPSHLFLAGKSMIPTHNSILRSAYRPWYYKMNIEETEAIGVERDLAGLPVMYVPFEVLMDPSKAALKQSLEDIIRNVRRDEQEGVLMPVDPEHPELYKFELMTTGGTRQFDTNEIILRYDARIAGVVLADFVMIGHEAVGSFALATEKRHIFEKAVLGWMDAIAGVLNTHLVPRLFDINTAAFSGLEELPKIGYSMPHVPTLEEVVDTVTKLSDAGAELFPNLTLTNTILTLAGLPEVEEGDLNTIQEFEPTKTTSEATKKARTKIPVSELLEVVKSL